jgi:hypothetical protein
MCFNSRIDGRKDKTQTGVMIEQRKKETGEDKLNNRS